MSSIRTKYHPFIFIMLLLFPFKSFEKELKTKLSQKTTGRLTEEAVLIKNFKYFDLNSSGTVDFGAFIKSCEKIGVHTYTKPVHDLYKNTSNC